MVIMRPVSKASRVYGVVIVPIVISVPSRSISTVDFRSEFILNL